MKLLGWDTSSKTGAIVALEWDPSSKAGWQGVRLVSEWTLNVDATHSDHLLWGIHQVLSASRWDLSDLDLLAVGQGPGSFTGLRIGVTTARTLAHALKKPLIGVSSLACLARPVAQAFAADSKSPKTLVIAATDACKGEVFALFGQAAAVSGCVVKAEGDLPGLWKSGVEEKVLSAEKLTPILSKKIASLGPKARWVLVGEAQARYPEIWKKLPEKKRADPKNLFVDYVQGRYLGLLAWEAYQAGLVRRALDVHPRYLRASDAELKLKAGLLNNNAPTRGDLG